MRASGYCRVSTEEQAREGYGLAAQEQAIRAYCQAQGWELVELYIDAGVSGKSLRGRDALERLLGDAEAGRFERLIFWKLDRLGRNLRDLLAISDRLEAVGVGIVSIQEAIDTGTATGRLMRSILGSLAEFEREATAERIKAAAAAKAKGGELIGPLPLGYQREEAGQVVLDPATAPLIREAFDRYATGRYSLREMGQWAARVDLRSAEGNPLDRLSVRKILTNVSYTGQVAYHRRQGGGVVAKGQHPALVEQAVFDRVQEALISRRHAPPQKPYGREPYPLSTVAICSSCEAPMLGAATIKANKYRYRHMRCSTAQRRGREACIQPMVRAEVLEGHLAAYLKDMRLPLEYLGAVVEELQQRRSAVAVVGQRPQLERQAERWRRLFVLGDIDEERYRREMLPLRRQLAKMERNDSEPLDVERALSYLRDVGSLWAESPRALQREFVREVFQRIVVEGKEIASLTPQPLYAPLFVIDRRERFDGLFCRMAPRVGLEPTT